MEFVLMADNFESRPAGRDDPAARLILRARAGDTTAFDQLITGHQRRVISLAWRLLGNPDDARDAAQEAFLRLYRFIDKYDPTQDFSGWLYRIVVNVCRDFQRKRRHNVSSFEAELEAGTIAEPASPLNTESAAMAAEEQAIVLKALATLSAKERAALVLRDLEGLPTEEVARILGSSPTTVRSQISAARVKIKAFRNAWERKRPRPRV
jgi:RNA polymerase sigma-70 factor (ECF subfamily)